MPIWCKQICKSVSIADCPRYVHDVPMNLNIVLPYNFPYRSHSSSIQRPFACVSEHDLRLFCLLRHIRCVAYNAARITIFDACMNKKWGNSVSIYECSHSCCCLFSSIPLQPNIFFFLVIGIRYDYQIHVWTVNYDAKLLALMNWKINSGITTTHEHVPDSVNICPSTNS